MASVLASVCAAILIAAAVLKLADRTGTAVALSSYGIVGRWARVAVGLVVAWELALAALLVAGVRAGAAATAITFVAFAFAQIAALASGRGGMACGCMGGAGRLSAFSVARALALAGAGGSLLLAERFAPVADAPPVLAASLVGTIATVARLRSRRPTAALDITGEGPPIGEPTQLADWLPAPDGRLRLAVFTSASCRLCRALAPEMGAVVADGRVVLRTFEEQREREVWQSVGVPGAPYAVVVAADGTVAAKGTINDGRQLRSVIADAHARQGLPLISALGPDSRRDFLGKAIATAGAVAAGSTVTALIEPGEAEAFHFCGHIYTTDGCPHPTGLPRIDSRGRPLRAADGRRVDDLGRLIDASGLPIDDGGRPLLDPDGRRLPAAPRTAVCSLVGRRYGFRARTDGAWYRCCGGNVRKLVDCCTPESRRINGDAGLTGYCYQGRKVFCVMYYDTRVRC